MIPALIYLWHRIFLGHRHQRFWVNPELSRAFEYHVEIDLDSLQEVRRLAFIADAKRTFVEDAMSQFGRRGGQQVLGL